jgi:hypothetical protein
MKMIAQETVRVHFRNGLDVFAVQRQKVDVIPPFAENVLAAIAAIVDVVIVTVFKWDRFGHGDSELDLTGF